MNSPRNNEPTAEEIQAITGRTDVKHVATADTARGLVEAVKEAEAAPAVTFERSSTGHTDATVNGKTVAWYSPKRLGWDRKVTHYRAVVCGGGRGLWFSVDKHGGAHAARMAARAWICEKVAEKCAKPDATVEGVSNWLVANGLHGAAEALCDGESVESLCERLEGYARGVEKTLRGHLYLTSAQRELVLEALEDSADGWELAAEDNRNLSHNDGSHAEQCSRDARDTLTAIKNQLK